MYDEVNRIARTQSFSNGVPMAPVNSLSPGQHVLITSSLYSNINIKTN